MISAFDRTYKIGTLLSTIDWLTFNVVFLLSYYLKWFPRLDWDEHFSTYFITANAAYIIALQVKRILLHHRWNQSADVLNNTSKTAVTFIILYTSLLGMLTDVRIPDIISSLFLAMTIFVCTSIERLILRTYIIHRRSVSSNRVNTVLLGTGNMAQKAADVMNNTWNGYNLLGYFSDSDSNPITNTASGEPVQRLGDICDIIDYIKKHHVDELYISRIPTGKVNLKTLTRICDNKMIRMFYIPSNEYGEFRKAKIKEFGDIYVLQQYDEPLRDVRNRIRKRLFDIIVSLIFLCTLFPFILVIVFVISKITMPGPLFFKQKRTGYDGRDFWCYKFRSMKVNKDSDTVQAVKNDPRVTKWGSFMRHTNIDELPQFINVLKGDMSIVGPRPHMLAHTDYYSKLIYDYMIRHYVKPGITGWAQTHGERGETKTEDDMRRRVEKDIWYIEHWSLWLDVQIILKTVANAIHGEDKAY